MENESLHPVDSFEALVCEYENKLFRTALATLGNVEEAEDILQDTFIKLYERKEPFENKEHEKAWLLRVTINLCKNKLRSSWWRKRAPLLDIYPAETKEDYELLDDVMSLPTKYRTVIHLYYYEGYQTKEIAALLDQKESTIRSLLLRARQKLKVVLEESYVYPLRKEHNNETIESTRRL